ncbi:hypothetical protein MYX04_05725 [Nitrospiraceae bacterium AH_259_D15_M11_P09]|nr:hypothetical protein [Nitrospiraceae bacterium AH_259_D15_M11_P09]
MSGPSDRLCPVCQRVRLLGRQTVCGGVCRIERSRQRKAQAQAERDSKVRLYLKAARVDVEAALGLLEEPENRH